MTRAGLAWAPGLAAFRFARSARWLQAVAATVVQGLVLVLAIALLSVRAYRSLGGPALQPWHTFVPVELTVDEMDAGDWSRYLDTMDTQLTELLRKRLG